MDLLHHLIRGGSRPKGPIIIPPREVVKRQSTNLLAVSDSVVSRALDFIWSHYGEQISIDDVALSAGVSRSKLTRKFRQYLGHGVNAELRRKRLERVCKLLRRTDLTIAEIAARCGFPSLPYFNNAFKKAFGSTPGNYRKNKFQA